MNANGKPCDWYLFNENDAKCDPFVKIFINGNLDYTSDVEHDTDTITVFVKYRTPKISKDSKITFEMRDDDTGGSELLLRKTLSIDELTKDFWVKFSTIQGRMDSANT